MSRVFLDNGPARSRQDSNSDLMIRKVLLMFQTLIGSDENFEAFTFSNEQQFTVSRAAPTLFLNSGDRV